MKPETDDDWMLDASVFTSRSHVHTVAGLKERHFYVSQALHEMLFGRYDRFLVLKTLSHFHRGPIRELPAEKLDMGKGLRPYKAKEEYVQSIVGPLSKVELPHEVIQIILDEVSFLREHSRLLLYSKKTIQRLRKSGVSILDGSNKSYDAKHALFERYRGPKWLVATTLEIASLGALASNPMIAAILGGAGFLVAVVDP